MALIPCPECSAQISDSAKACPKCGVPLEKKETKKCFECNSDVEKDKTVCPNCGVDFSLEPKKEEPTKKSPNFYTCKYCNFKSEAYSEYCPNCKLNLAGVLKPGIFTCKFCGHRSESWSANCPKCQRDINGNVKPQAGYQPISIPNPPKKGNGLKIALLAFFLVVAIVVIVFMQKGHSLNSMLNAPNTFEISASCSPVSNMLLTSVVTVTVTNDSSSTYNNVSVNIICYDANGNVIEQKQTTFERTLYGNSYLTKPVTVTSNAVRCEANVENASPN